jgi:hypothetical protein
MIFLSAVFGVGFVFGIVCLIIYRQGVCDGIKLAEKRGSKSPAQGIRDGVHSILKHKEKKEEKKKQEEFNLGLANLLNYNPKDIK